jgi:hypothetical protein
VIHGQVGGNDTSADVAVMHLENPQFEHFLASGGILTALDDADHDWSSSWFAMAAAFRRWLSQYATSNVGLSEVDPGFGTSR